MSKSIGGNYGALNSLLILRITSGASRRGREAGPHWPVAVYQGFGVDEHSKRSLKCEDSGIISE